MIGPNDSQANFEKEQNQKKKRKHREKQGLSACFFRFFLVFRSAEGKPEQEQRRPSVCFRKPPKFSKFFSFGISKYFPLMKHMKQMQSVTSSSDSGPGIDLVPTLDHGLGPILFGYHVLAAGQANQPSALLKFDPAGFAKERFCDEPERTCRGG